MCLICSPPLRPVRCASCRRVRSSQDEAAFESALQVNTSVPQVAVQPPIVINVTTNVTTIPINPAREEFLTGMVRTYQTLDEDATTSVLLDDFFAYLMDSCVGGAPGPEDLNWTFNGATFFMMTILTTIGYGTFAPSLPLGRWMVIFWGSVTIVLFGLVSRPAVDLVEVLETRTERLLLFVSGRLSGAKPLSTQRQMLLKGASAMLVCHGVIMAAALIVYYDRDEEDPLHEEWDYGTCYYFCFVTFSSIGLGDFSLGPADNSNYELGRLLVQALIIMFGMAAFNCSTGAWCELVQTLGVELASQVKAWAVEQSRLRKVQPSPIKETTTLTQKTIFTKETADERTTLTQTTTLTHASKPNPARKGLKDLKRAITKVQIANVVARPAVKCRRDVGIFGALGKAVVVADPKGSHVAQAQPGRCEQRLRACLAVIGYLALFYASILICAAIFVHVEAATEEAEAIAMRLEENELRESMGLERLSLGSQDSVRLSPPSAPPEARPGSREEAAAALAALSQTPAEERGAALESIVGDYEQVVKNEAAADSLTDFFRDRLATCKSSSGDYSEPRWSFEGATFFMMTIATTIGYGTFAPKTQLGKAIVVLIGHLSIILYGICIGVIVGEMTTAIDWIGSTMLFVSGKVARAIRHCRGGPPSSAQPAPEPSAEQEARYKLLVALGLLHGYIGICAHWAQGVFGRYLETEMTFEESYYFGFCTFSTIGLGDYALQPFGLLEVNPRTLLFIQVLTVFVGLAFFSCFVNHGAAWFNEIAPIAWAIAIKATGWLIARRPRFMSPKIAPHTVHISPPASPPAKDAPTDDKDDAVEMVSSLSTTDHLSVLKLASTPMPTPELLPWSPRVSAEDSEHSETLPASPANESLPRHASFLKKDEQQRARLQALHKQDGIKAARVPKPRCKKYCQRALSLGQRCALLAASAIGTYVVIIAGGVCLYYSESAFERMGSCSAMRDENQLRMSIRLPPMESPFC